MNETNYTESQVQTSDGFTKTIRRHNIKPERFDEPLTIIEFSLTNESKQKLESEIVPIIEKHKKTDSHSIVLNDEEKKRLKELIETTFPKEIIDYFKQLNIKELDKIPPYVYVVKNLPEVIDKNVMSKYTSEACAFWVGKGFALATGMEHTEFGRNERGMDYPKIIAGSNLHKHPNDVTALNGIHQSEGTKTYTRFTDFVGLNDDQKMQQPHIAEMSKAEKEEIDKPAKRWENMLSSYSRDFNDHDLKEHTGKHDLKHYSQEILLDKGSMAIWSENGRIFHQGLQTEFEKNAKVSGTFRSFIYHEFDKPKTQER